MRQQTVMHAMVLEEIGGPLLLKEVPRPEPLAEEVLIRVKVCGVCRTDLHILEGDLKFPRFPLILGHQVVGIVEKCGAKVSKSWLGKRVGIPWLGGVCGCCEFCSGGQENLCDQAVFTGYDRQGGYAEYTTADPNFLLIVPEGYTDEEAAPLLCAGLIGYRGLQKLGNVDRVGFYGFGSSAHILIQIMRFLRKEVYVFTRPGDAQGQEFARSLGAVWAGGSDVNPPKLLDGALLFAPVGDLYVQALKAVKKGGCVVSAGIHMSDIPSFPYDLLWGERSMSSVANLTRKDGAEFMRLAQQIRLQLRVTSFSLEQANEALSSVKHGKYDGSIVLAL